MPHPRHIFSFIFAGAQKRTEGTPAKDVVLKMRGVATTRVRFLSDYAKGSKSKLKYSEYADNFPEERKFFSFDLPLASFEGGVAGPGVHTVPFAVVLPEVLPSSTLVRCGLYKTWSSVVCDMMWC